MPARFYPHCLFSIVGLFNDQLGLWISQLPCSACVVHYTCYGNYIIYNARMNMRFFFVGKIFITKCHVKHSTWTLTWLGLNLVGVVKVSKTWHCCSPILGVYTRVYSVGKCVSVLYKALCASNKFLACVRVDGVNMVCVCVCLVLSKKRWSC